MRIRSGQTIMELLVAMTVIIIGLFGALTLVFSNLSLMDRDTDEVIAVNAAREGVELAKNRRDSYWLANAPLNTAFSNGADNTGVWVWDGTTDAPTINYEPNDFTHDATKLGTTIFRRLMTFHPICEDFATRAPGVGCSPLRTIGMRVESHMQWPRKGRVNNLTIYEDLYDWR